MQIDFGQKLVMIASVMVRVHLLVTVLSYSRRIFVKAFLAERPDDWRDGIASAFRHFGGVPLTMLGDNARSLVLAHNRTAQTITFRPNYHEFCRDWDVVPRACAPRSRGNRARPWLELAAFKRPKKIVIVDELPRNAMGRALKADLRALYKDSSAARHHRTPERPRQSACDSVGGAPATC